MNSADLRWCHPGPLGFHLLWPATQKCAICTNAISKGSGIGGGGFFLTGKDFRGRLDGIIPACAFFLSFFCK